MAITNLSTSSLVSGVKRRRVWDQLATTDGFFQIATTTLNTTASSITFSSIPQDYTHLQIRGITRATGNTQVDMTINGDTGNNYAFHQLGGNGSAAYSDNSANRANIPAIIGAPSSGETTGFAGGFIDILDYKDTNKFKTVRSLAGWDGNGAGIVQLTSGLWRSTSAISTITLTSRSPYSFVQYVSFALYGIKG
jgi:hypothetical protein